MDIGILALGSSIGDLEVPNEAVAPAAGVTPEWIVRKTGIHTRRYAAPATPTSSLAADAVEDLVHDYPDALAGVGAVVVATSTGDQPQPATAAKVADRLGLPPVAAFDVNAVCCGFMYALAIGAALAKETWTGPKVLVIAADKYSQLLDVTDRSTAPIFGDGAGAAVVGPVRDGCGLRALRLRCRGEFYDAVGVRGGGSRQPLDPAALVEGAQYFRMRGRVVADYVLEHFPRLIDAVLDDAGLKRVDIDRYVFHQANPNMLRQLADGLGIDRERVPLTGPFYGNLGAASLPVTLHWTHKQRPLARGQRVFLGAIGGGLTDGGCVYIVD
ncbi:ketoacyl-ACP synthase III [Actinophytocola sp.]|uniref:3-oxoacyl-ACP synthase III family protein n=1 Tax=Actinophytocola sp. TaxID=1872138 RepID=UPI002ED0E5B5